MTRGNSSTNKAPPETAKTTAPGSEGHQPGEGIRSMKTSSVFRAVNFELYAKPVSFPKILLQQPQGELKGAHHMLSNKLEQDITCNCCRFSHGVCAKLENSIWRPSLTSTLYFTSICFFKCNSSKSINSRFDILKKVEIKFYSEDLNNGPSVKEPFKYQIFYSLLFKCRRRCMINC